MDGSYGNNKNFQFLTFKSIQTSNKGEKEFQMQKDQPVSKKQYCKHAEKQSTGLER